METTTPTPDTCGWLVQRTVPWINDPEFEPDFPEDTYHIVECGEPVRPDGRYALCDFHHGAMDMDEQEFERHSELAGGNAFS